jgi:metal-responsive CopG/Arc/MetJ family transcriptional regulator
MTTRITGISFEKNLLKKIDSQPGLIPRSAYISKIIANFIKKQKKDVFDEPSLSLNTSREIEDIERT